MFVHSIATVSGHNTWYMDRIRWNDWRKYDEDQRSSTLDLFTNSSYLLVGLLKQSTHTEFLRVSTLLPATCLRQNVSRLVLNSAMA